MATRLTRLNQQYIPDAQGSVLKISVSNYSDFYYTAPEILIELDNGNSLLTIIDINDGIFVLKDERFDNIAVNGVLFTSGYALKTYLDDFKQGGGSVPVSTLLYDTLPLYPSTQLY